MQMVLVEMVRRRWWQVATITMVFSLSVAPTMVVRQLSEVYSSTSFSSSLLPSLCVALTTPSDVGGVLEKMNL